MKQRPNMLLEAQLELVFQEVADFYGVKLSDILGKMRLRPFIEPRFVAIHLAKKIGGRVSWPEVGWFANRDHTSCVYADQQVKIWREVDKDFPATLEKVACRVASIL